MQELCKIMARELHAHLQETTVAVVDFTDLNHNTLAVGKYFANEMLYSLVRMGSLIKVVNSQPINHLLKSTVGNLQSFIGSRVIRQLRQVVDVEALLIGAVSEKDNQTQLAIHILDLVKGRITLSLSGECCSPEISSAFGNNYACYATCLGINNQLITTSLALNDFAQLEGKGTYSCNYNNYLKTRLNNPIDV